MAKTKRPPHDPFTESVWARADRDAESKLGKRAMCVIAGLASVGVLAYSLEANRGELGTHIAVGLAGLAAGPLSVYFYNACAAPFKQRREARAEIARLHASAVPAPSAVAPVEAAPAGRRSLTKAEIDAIIEHLRGPTSMVTLTGNVLYSPVRFLRFYGKSFTGVGKDPEEVRALCKREGVEIDRASLGRIMESLRFKHLVTGGEARLHGFHILDPRVALTGEGEQVVDAIADLPNGHALI